MAAKVISVALQKGGCGKSSTAQAIASTLGVKGYKTLLIDCDSQRNVTKASGVTPDQTITDVFAGECNIRDAVIPVSLFYNLIPSDKMLANLEHIPDLAADHLDRHLQMAKDSYDYIILDTPPLLGNLLKNCLYASDYVLIPLEARPYCVSGIADLQETIEAVRSVVGRPEILGMLIVKYNTRAKLNRITEETLQEMAKEMGTKVFDTHIRECIALPEAQLYGKPLIEYAPKSTANLDYIDLTNEILNMIKEG